MGFCWISGLYLEEVHDHLTIYIAVCHAILDKIASLNMGDKLKPHLLLRQASLSSQDKNMFARAVRGIYDLDHLT